MQRADYLTLRRTYTPTNLRLIIVAEAPPAPKSGKPPLYFYKPDGSTGEPLFLALMQQLKRGFDPPTKEVGLRAFQQAGWMLVDATYRHVDVGLDDEERAFVLGEDYGLLRRDLRHLMRGGSVPVVLIKSNVCKLLEPRLLADGFDVRNRGHRIPYPSNGRQPEFHRLFGAVRRRLSEL